MSYSAAKGFVEAVRDGHVTIPDYTHVHYTRREWPDCSSYMALKIYYDTIDRGGTRLEAGRNSTVYIESLNL